jgi:hypothetical protein
MASPALTTARPLTSAHNVQVSGNASAITKWNIALAAIITIGMITVPDVERMKMRVMIGRVVSLVESD